MTIASVLGEALLVPLAVVNAVFVTETLLGLVKKPPAAVPDGPMPSVAILMPAHNEAAMLTTAFPMLCRMIATGCRVIVVADNCTDATGAIAKSAGCEVVVRSDMLQRGKGYALAAGLAHLRRDPPDVVIVLDADCSIDDNALALIASRASVDDCAVQAAYLFRHDPLALPSIQISNFALTVKNLVRQRGACRLGAAAVLTGSGMAFPWRLFLTLDLATGDVVEDLALGIDLVRRQEPPVFEEAAAVWSDASNMFGTTTQRSRWEGGFVATGKRFALPLIFEGTMRFDFKMFWLGAHLLVPALSIVLLINVLAVLVYTGLALIASAPLLAASAATLLLLVVATIVLAWIFEGRQHMRAAVFLKIPLYLAWKIAMYGRLLTGRQSVEWIRTERPGKE